MDVYIGFAGYDLVSQELLLGGILLWFAQLDSQIAIIFQNLDVNMQLFPVEAKQYDGLAGKMLQVAPPQLVGTILGIVGFWKHQGLWISLCKAG